MIDYLPFGPPGRKISVISAYYYGLSIVFIDEYINLEANYLQVSTEAEDTEGQGQEY